MVFAILSTRWLRLAALHVICATYPNSAGLWPSELLRRRAAPAGGESPCSADLRIYSSHAAGVFVSPVALVYTLHHRVSNGIRAAVFSGKRVGNRVAP